jgi:hypothetical protein
MLVNLLRLKENAQMFLSSSIKGQHLILFILMRIAKKPQYADMYIYVLEIFQLFFYYSDLIDIAEYMDFIFALRDLKTPTANGMISDLLSLANIYILITKDKVLCEHFTNEQGLKVSCFISFIILLVPIFAIWVSKWSYSRIHSPNAWYSSSYFTKV